MTVTKPWAKKSTGDKVLTVIVILFVLIVLITLKGLLFGGDSNPDQSTNNESASQNLSEEDEIKLLITDQLKGKNKQDKEYLKDLRVNNLGAGSGYTVFVEFNADMYTAAGLNKGRIEDKMAEIYTALFTSDKNIQNAGIGAYLPLSDQYGNEKDVLVYKSTLDKAVADKINFNADASELKLVIIPNAWTATNIHADLQ